MHLKRDTWDETQPLEPWLRAIARHKLVDHLRRRGVTDHVDIEDLAETLAGPISDPAGSTADARHLLAGLPERQRHIVEGISLEGQSAREVGIRLGMSEGAVRVTLHRALKALAADGSSAMVLYRLQQGARESGLKPLEALFYKVNAWNGCVIGRGADFGPGFVLLHSNGVVINGKVRGGENVQVQHQVTIGNNEREEAPVLGSNIVIGGLSGSFAVLAGAAASDPALGPLPWSLALVLFLWTPPHFWSLAIAGQADYAAAGIPMLPVVVGVPRAARIVHWSTLALVASSLLPCVFGAGWIYFVGAAVGGALFLYRSYRLAHHPTRQTAIACFLASLVQLCLVLGGICLDVALG